MKEPETMRDKMIKMVKGEITPETFMEAMCSQRRWYSVQNSFGMSLNFPDFALHDGHHYNAKKDGGDMRTHGFELHLDLFTGRWSIVIFANHVTFASLLDWNHECPRSDVHGEHHRPDLLCTYSGCHS
jgi:hypothetical protein